MALPSLGQTDLETTTASTRHDIEKPTDAFAAFPNSNETARDATPTQDEIAITSRYKDWVDQHNGVNEPSAGVGTAEAPPLPEEAIPPLPAEPPPTVQEQDDGWAPVWDDTVQAYYFYNRFTGASQWTNPRVPEPVQPGPPGVDIPTNARSEVSPAPRAVGGYDPAIHGDYDENAWYAKPSAPEESTSVVADPATMYQQSAAFNRFTGRFQNEDLNPENFNDENKSKRQMNAFFDVDAAANSHDGKSLKAERSGKKLSKSELKHFKEKRKAKKEEKRKAWLRD